MTFQILSFYFVKAVYSAGIWDSFVIVSVFVSSFKAGICFQSISSQFTVTVGPVEVARTVTMNGMWCPSTLMYKGIRTVLKISVLRAMLTT
jgi:hypothetical protein